MPPSVFNPLHYDNATYIFLLALYAGVERMQLSCDTATYSLPVNGVRVEQMSPSVFNPLHYDNATYISFALHAGVERVQLSCDTATYPFTGRCDTATYSLPVNGVRVEQMPQSVFNPLHYDNATCIFLLALYAGVERMQLSCDTATYSLPVAATR